MDENTPHTYAIFLTLYGEDAERGVGGIAQDLNSAINDHGLLGGNFTVVEVPRS